MKLIEPEYWDKPYRCHKCNIRFETKKLQQLHVQSHRVGICPACKKEGLIDEHHYSYKDYDKDSTKNTMPLCNSCHGQQQNIQNMIRNGIPVTYIGHLIITKL